MIVSLSFSQKHIFLIRPTDSITIITNHLFKPVLKRECLLATSFTIHCTSQQPLMWAVIMHIKHFFQKRSEYTVKLHLFLRLFSFLDLIVSCSVKIFSSMPMILLISTDIDSHHGY